MDLCNGVTAPDAASLDAALFLVTDGACWGNPGPGGWGFLAKTSQETLVENMGFEKHTTNNRMELCAVIEALRWCLKHQVSFQRPLWVLCDSQYVVKGITQWIHAWQAKGWLTSQKKPVENQDLWKDLLEVVKPFTHIHWQWVRGHSGHPDNERIDTLLQAGLKAYLLG